MQNKTYAEFLRRFIGVKGSALSSDNAVQWFLITEAGRGEILEVGEDYVVYSDTDKSRSCVPITAFSIRYFE